MFLSGKAVSEKELDKKKASNRSQYKWMGFGIELGGVIGLFMWLGHLADEKLETQRPWFMLAGFYINETLGFENIAALLPHELGGLATGVITPVALLWVVVAFFERSKIYEREAHALRWHLKQLTYPSDAAETRVALRLARNS